MEQFFEKMEQSFKEYNDSHIKDIQKLIDNISWLSDKADDVTDVIDHTSVRILKKFRSPITIYYKNLIERFCHEKAEFEYDVLNNMDFYIRFYFPKSEIIDRTKKKTKHIVVMFNGLDESLIKQHFTLYDRIASSLNSIGLMAVLLPTPFHLNRSARLISELVSESEGKNPGKITIKKPSSKLMERPFLLFVNFAQCLYDFRLLSLLMTHKFEEIQSENESNYTLEIKKPTKHDIIFYNRYFDSEDIKISILGYSFGALKALMCLKKYSDVIKKCVLLGGGGTVKDFKLEPMINNAEWQKILDRISPTGSGCTTEDKLEYNEFNRCHDKQIISNILFAQDDVLHPDQVKKLILVAGAKDRVINPNSLKRLSGEEHGLTIIQIADLSHFLVDDPFFHRWYLRIMSLIGDFLNDPEGELVTREQCLKILLTFNFFSKNAFENAANKQIQKSFEEIFDETLYQSLTKLTDDKETAKKIRDCFRIIYMVSKAYVVSDEKLISELNKLRQRNNLLFGQIVTDRLNITFEEIEGSLKDKLPSEVSGEVFIKKGYINKHNIQPFLSMQVESYNSKLGLTDADKETLNLLFQNWESFLL